VKQDGAVKCIEAEQGGIFKTGFRELTFGTVKNTTEIKPRANIATINLMFSSRRIITTLRQLMKSP
jgi:hypothetical protein